MVFFEIFIVVTALLTVLYAAIILFIDRGVRKTFKTGPGPVANSSVRVTVIVPARNEAARINACLEGLAVQDYPAGLFEVIVTDDFSEDSTCRLVESFIARSPGRNFFLLTPEKNDGAETGKKEAISRAVERAKGELILSTDADTVHQPSWISAFVTRYLSSRPAMILGPVAFYNEKTLFQKIQSLEFMGIMAVTAGSAWYAFPLMCNGANLAFSRNAFERAGGYRGNLEYASGDDMFLMTKIKRQHKPGSVQFLGTQEAVVFTDAEKSWKGFIHQRIRWISKNRGYTDPWIRFFSLLTWSVNFLLLAGMILGLADPDCFYAGVILWLIKILTEFLPVSRMAQFLNKKHLTGYYFIAQVFQLVYVTLLGAAGNFLPYQWKGRTFRK